MSNEKDIESWKTLATARLIVLRYYISKAGAPEDWMNSHPGLPGIQTEEDGRSWLSLRERMAREEGRREGLSQALNIAKGCHDYGGGYRDSPELLAAFHHGMDILS